MCSILIGYKNWWSYGHPKTLGQMNSGILVTCGNQYRTSNIRSQFIALKQVAKLDGCHSPTVGRKYKSRYLLESRHWDISSDAINFSYWRIRLFSFGLHFTQKTDFFSSHHFMAHYKSHHFTLIRPYFRSFSLIFVILFVKSVQIFTCQQPIPLPSLAHQDLCRFYIKSRTWHHIFDFFTF